MTKKIRERTYPGYKLGDPTYRLIHDQGRVMSGYMKQWLATGLKNGHPSRHMEELRARATQ